MDAQVRTMTGPGAAGNAGDARKASLRLHPGPRRLGYVRARRAAVFAGFAAVAFAAFGFVAFVASLERFEQVPRGRTDGIVALTGGSQRIGDAIDLLARGYAGRLLITGVNEHTSKGEIARLNPGQRRLFDCCVDLDYRARNTIGNAIETQRWAEANRFRSLIVVTSNYHMPRTLIELDQALPGVSKVPYSVVTTATADAWWRNPSAARLLLSEYAKLVAAWLRTRLEREPGPTIASLPATGAGATGTGVRGLLETRR